MNKRKRHRSAVPTARPIYFDGVNLDLCDLIERIKYGVADSARARDQELALAMKTICAQADLNRSLVQALWLMKEELRQLDRRVLALTDDVTEPGILS